MPDDPSNEPGFSIRQCSPSDTIPASPEPLDGYETTQQPFARLVPISRAARQAFESAVDAIKQDLDGHAHVRRNMVIEPVRHQSISVVSDFTDSEVAEAEGPHDRPLYRFKGYFCFRLDNPPIVPRIGWVLGDGRSSAARQVDFLLSAPRQAKDIAGKHAMVYLHSRSCRLVLGARHKTTMQASDGGGTMVRLSKSAVSAQLGSEVQIRIGECVYLFEYLDFAKSETHEQQLAAFMKQTHGPSWEGLLQLLGSSPEDTPMRLHTYTWPLGAFAKGSFGQVTAGTGSNGNPVAIKRFNRPREEQLSAHRRMMSYIGAHANIVQLLDCYAGPDANIPEAYCIYQPLACTTLHDVIGQKELPTAIQVALFRQYVDALAFLHDEKGVMHRDIKPGNLGIVTWNPPVGVIFDLDSATREETSGDHMQGTLGFLAPEIVALKRWDVSLHQGVPLPPYGRKVDVWALGFSAYVIYAGAAMANRCITAESYQMIQQDLERGNQFDEDIVQVSFAKIMLQMLCWDVCERFSATQAVKAFQELDALMDETTTTDIRGPGMKRPCSDTPP